MTKFNNRLYRPSRIMVLGEMLKPIPPKVQGLQTALPALGAAPVNIFPQDFTAISIALGIPGQRPYLASSPTNHTLLNANDERSLEVGVNNNRLPRTIRSCHRSPVRR
jgi:hypothetical protein